jgi:hypothetical protein
MKKQKPTGPFWRNDSPVSFRVLGEPRPAPKMDIVPIQRWVGQGAHRRKVSMSTNMAHDYRERTVCHPISGKPTRNGRGKIIREKYDEGYHARWFRTVQDAVSSQMARMGLDPFPANHPIALGVMVWRTKPEGNDKLLPTVVPDDDNYRYYIHNALKKPGKDSAFQYPEGLLYYDDNCAVYRPFPEGKFWATEQEPPGCLITVQDAMYLLDEMEEFQPGVKNSIEARQAQSSLFRAGGQQ